MGSKKIIKIKVEWLPLHAGFSVSFYRGQSCEEGLMIRQNVAIGETPKEDWHHELTGFTPDEDVTVETVRSLLATLGTPAWDSNLHKGVSSVELRGQTEMLTFRLTLNTPARASTLTEEQLEEANANLESLRTELWG